jgi:hypothetical protein
MSPAMEWQPIETCPKMTAVLLYATGYYIGHFNETNSRWWVESDGTQTAAEASLNGFNKPTHWMPLPAPPKKEG